MYEVATARNAAETGTDGSHTAAARRKANTMGESAIDSNQKVLRATVVLGSESAQSEPDQRSVSYADPR